MEPISVFDNIMEREPVDSLVISLRTLGCVQRHVYVPDTFLHRRSLAK